MSPGVLVMVLGLCNVVAGALLAFAPALVMPVEGVESPAAVLATRSAAGLLLAVALGAWAIPANAVRPYLWIFGVSVKVLASMIWAASAVDTGVPQVWVGASLDLAVAGLIAVGLMTSASPGSR